MSQQLLIIKDNVHISNSYHHTELGIYKRKQENTLSTRKAIKKKEKKKKENTLSTKKATKKRRKRLSFFLDRFLVRERDFFFFFFLGRFPGRKRVFFVFFYKFSPLMIISFASYIVSVKKKI